MEEKGCVGRALKVVVGRKGQDSRKNREGVKGGGGEARSGTERDKGVVRVNGRGTGSGGKVWEKEAGDIKGESKGVKAMAGERKWLKGAGEGGARR